MQQRCGAKERCSSSAQRFHRSRCLVAVHIKMSVSDAATIATASLAGDWAEVLFEEVRRFAICHALQMRYKGVVAHVI
jgi:hypothetical protein